MHTPGPWYADKISDCATYNIFPYGSTYALLQVGSPELDGTHPYQQATAANARLIASAPDLLQTLEAILKSLEFEQRMYGDADPRRSTIDFPRAISMARAAIAKATA